MNELELEKLLVISQLEDVDLININKKLEELNNIKDLDLEGQPLYFISDNNLELKDYPSEHMATKDIFANNDKNYEDYIKVDEVIINED